VTLLCMHSVQGAAPVPGAKRRVLESEPERFGLVPEGRSCASLVFLFAPARSVTFWTARSGCPARSVADRVLGTGVLYPESLPPTKVAAGSPVLMMFFCKSRPVHALLRVTDDQEGRRLPLVLHPPAGSLERRACHSSLE